MEEPIITVEDVTAAVQKKLGHDDFRVLSQNVQSAGRRIGLLGEHYFLEIVILDRLTDEERPLKFFLKTVPKCPGVAAFARNSSAFLKEQYSYELFDKFRTKGAASIIEKCVPRFYAAQPDRFLVLQDLREEGYEMPDKMRLLDYEELLVVLHHLARFHASSLVYETNASEELDKQVRLFDDRPELLKDTLYSRSDTILDQSHSDSVLKCILTEIDHFGFPKVLACGRSFAEAAAQIYQRIFELVKPSKVYRNVLSHGDLWSSNVLLKRDESDGTGRRVASCKFVDFQCVRYLPPSHDVLYLIYLNTTRAFREKHLYELLGIYYSYLEKILKNAGIDASSVIPFFDFLHSCEEQKLFAVLEAAGIIPLILSDNDRLESYFTQEELYREVLLGDRSRLLQDNATNEAFLKRAKESIEDLMESCEKLTAND